MSERRFQLLAALGLIAYATGVVAVGLVTGWLVQ
jgi:hypothetical protein